MNEEEPDAKSAELQSAGKQERIRSIIALHGHPLHPMLITFPIALLIGALVCDLALWWTADPFWARMAFWLIAGGLVGGGLAALSGIADFMLVPAIREHVTSWSHFILAIMAMSIAATNLMLRWDDEAAAVLPWGIAVSALNVLMLSFAGWLGGNLVFRHLIGTGVKE